jgi:hypothetical protein
MPRSLASVYGAYTVLFLGSTFQKTRTSVMDLACRREWASAYSTGFAITRDGAALLMVFAEDWERKLGVFRVADGACLSTIPNDGHDLQQPFAPCQIWIAQDGFVFATDLKNHCVLVLTPSFDVHGVVGAHCLRSPYGVCADDRAIFVSECFENCISVLRRGDGTLLRRFGDGILNDPLALCFMSGNRRIAVADNKNRRISVFDFDGKFFWPVGGDILCSPCSVACSAFDELIVVDHILEFVHVFTPSGALRHSLRSGWFREVAVHSDALFALLRSHSANEQFAVMV